MLNRLQKGDCVRSISESLSKAKATFLVDFKGLNVEQMTGLRKKLGQIDSEIRVVRNTLARLALKNHPDMEGTLQAEFAGTNAFVFAYEDPGASAKALCEFGGEIELLKLKTGVMEGQRLDKARIRFLATLPSKGELRGQLLRVMLSPATQMVRVMKAVPGALVHLLNAYKDSKNE